LRAIRSNIERTHGWREQERQTDALETFWLARGTQPLAALTNIGLQLFIGMLAVWIGNLFAHHMGSWLATVPGTNQNDFIWFDISWCDQRDAWIKYAVTAEPESIVGKDLRSELADCMDQNLLVKWYPVGWIDLMLSTIVIKMMELKKRTLNIGLATALLIVLSACANQRPSLYSNEHLMRVGSSAAEQDIDKCIQHAERAGEGQENLAENAAVSTAGSAAIGAAAGGAGRRSGRPSWPRRRHRRGKQRCRKPDVFSCARSFRIQ
jgi:hypothetical protein